MYLKYFGFQRAPFELVPDPDFLFLGEAHEAALANLVMGLQSGKGFVAISGAVGAGKTTVLRALLRRLKRPDQVCFLSQPELDVAGLLRAVLDGFHLDCGDDAVVELRRRIRDFLRDAAEPGILIVDEAHLLSEESLEQLRLLSNMEEDQRKLLQIVLSGQPELKQLLSRPRLRPLAQRIEMFYDISPLSREETALYIERRLAIAGSPDGVSFENGAIDLIHHCSAGVPRLINLLADRSLVTGYVSDTGRITESLVREAYADLGEVTQSVMPGSPGGGGRRRTPRETPAPAVPEPQPERAGPRASVVPLPQRPARPRRRESHARRWLAAIGLVAVATVAVLSLGGSHLVNRDGATKAGTAPALRGPRPAAADPAGTAPTSGAVSPSRESPEAEGGRAGRSEDASAAAADGARYAVHVASFRAMDRAQLVADQLHDRLHTDTSIAEAELQTGRWYRVLVGDFATRQDASLLRRQLSSTGEFAFLRTVTVRPSAPSAPSPSPATGGARS